MNIQADIEWPDALPLPYLDYSGSPRNATMFSPLQSGVSRNRSRFHRSYSILALQWIFDSPTTYEAFQTFWTTTLSNGTAPFLIELRYPKESELTQWMVRFVGEGYDARYVDGNWVVLAQLYLMLPYELPDMALPLSGNYYSGS